MRLACDFLIFLKRAARIRTFQLVGMPLIRRPWHSRGLLARRRFHYHPVRRDGKVDDDLWFLPLLLWQVLKLVPQPDVSIELRDPKANQFPRTEMFSCKEGTALHEAHGNS